MKKILTFIKKETVLTVAWALAALSAFWVRPGAFYFDYNEDMENVNGFTVANGY